MVAWGKGAAVENGRGLEAGGSGATLAVVRAGGRGGSQGSEGGGAVGCSEQVTAADDGVVKIIVTLRYVTIRYDTWYKNIVPKPSDRLTCQCLPLQRI